MTVPSVTPVNCVSAVRAVEQLARVVTGVQRPDGFVSVCLVDVDVLQAMRITRITDTDHKFMMGFEIKSVPSQLPPRLLAGVRHTNYLHHHNLTKIPEFGPVNTPERRSPVCADVRHPPIQHEKDLRRGL